MKPTPLIDSKAKSCTVKNIDDASKACAIDLKKSLIDLKVSCRPRPLDFHEHTGFTLDSESNELQEELNNLKIFTDSNLMTINEKKTQIMCFNFRKSLKFPPIYRIGNGQQLEIVKKPKFSVSSSLMTSGGLSKWSTCVPGPSKRSGCSGD